VSSFETRVPIQKGHNFCSDRWISLKLLQEFPDAVFLVVDVESPLGEEEVSSLETSVYRFEMAMTFDPTVESPSKF
jgi:hypothetical protein